VISLSLKEQGQAKQKYHFRKKQKLMPEMKALGCQLTPATERMFWSERLLQFLVR
jgi:hypothetical protein